MNKFGAFFLGGALTLGSFGAGYLTRAATYEEPKRSSMSWTERKAELVKFTDRFKNLPVVKDDPALETRLLFSCYKACMEGVVDTQFGSGEWGMQQDLIVQCGWKDNFARDEWYRAFRN